MATIATHVLGVTPAPGDEADAMAADDADGRMGNVERLFRGRSQEGVPAVARELTEAVARHNDLHVMAEQAAAVSDLFVEDHLAAIRIATGFKQQRVSALHADVFSMTVALG